MKYRSNKSAQTPRFYVPEKGWQVNETDAASVRITPIKVWSYSCYNEYEIAVRDGDGHWTAPTSTDQLSGVERGLVFRTYPRQDTQGRTYVLVCGVVRMVDEEVAQLAQGLTTTNLFRADWNFRIPLDKWDAFRERVAAAGGELEDRSVKWEDVLSHAKMLQAGLHRLEELVDEAGRLSSETPKQMAALSDEEERKALAIGVLERYDAMAREAGKMYRHCIDAASELASLKDALDQEPGRFQEKVQVHGFASMIETLRTYKDLPQRLLDAAKQLAASLATLTTTLPAADGNAQCVDRWAPLTAALLALYPSANIARKSEGLLFRLGNSLILFTEDKVVAV